MVEQNDAVLQSLKRYIRAELDGISFYRMAAERTADARGKKMYVSLAHDEVGHAKKLAVQYQHVLNGGIWMSLDQLASLAGGLNMEQVSVFAEGQSSIIPQLDPSASDLDALLLGIEMEKASYEAYATTSSEVTDPLAREVFAFLMKEEQSHLDLLRSTHEYLAKTDSWFEEIERPIFEG